MSECMKVIKPKLERKGLNSLRDFFLDQWMGTNLPNNQEAEKHLKNFIETNDEDKVISRLDRGKVFLFFVVDSPYGYRLETQPAPDAGYEFKMVHVDEGVSLVYIRAKRGEQQNFKFISAELQGHYKVLRKLNFDRGSVKRWMNCRTSDKIICIPEIKKILENPVWTEGFLNYNSYFTASEYHHWVKKYEINFQTRKGFRVLISNIIKEIKK